MTDQELIGYLDRRFGEISQQLDEKIDGVREENRQTRVALEAENRQTRTTLEEEIRQTRVALEAENRQTRVVVEHIHSDMKILAEGLIAQGEISARLHSEVLRKIDDVHSMIAPLYRDLNDRTWDLSRRVQHLEEIEEQRSRDALAVVRERFGKP